MKGLDDLKICINDKQYFINNFVKLKQSKTIYIKSKSFNDNLWFLPPFLKCVGKIKQKNYNQET